MDGRTASRLEAHLLAAFEHTTRAEIIAETNALEGLAEDLHGLATELAYLLEFSVNGGRRRWRARSITGNEVESGDGAASPGTTERSSR
jgi:hypothetical protein